MYLVVSHNVCVYFAHSIFPSPCRGEEKIIRAMSKVSASIRMLNHNFFMIRGLLFHSKKGVILPQFYLV